MALSSSALIVSIKAPAADAAVAQPPAPVAPAGLVNDWLRGQSSSAQAWDLGGQFRVRYEAKEKAGSFPNNDFLQGLENSNDYFLFRTKVHLGYAPAGWCTAFVEGRDSHSVSDARPVTETDAFDLHQAYLRLGDPKQFPLLFKIGRQELFYGDERYIGFSDWSNVGRSFDAAKLRFENEVLWVDAFTGRQVLPRDGYFNVVNDYDWFSGLYGSTRRLVPWQDTELYFLARNVGAQAPNALAPGVPGTPSSARDIYTAGTRWKSAPSLGGGWDYTFEAVGQFGSIVQNGIRRDHRAFAVNGTGGYTWKEVWGAPRLAVGYDFASGDSDPSDGRNETFELLFGTNHRLYGLMDLFGLRNIHIPRAGVSLKPVQNLTISVDWLGFWMADTADFLYPESGPGRSQNGYGRNSTFDAHVGSEVDVLVNWRVASWGNLQGGYGHFFVGDYIRQSAANGGHGTEDADWFYAQAIFNF